MSQSASATAGASSRSRRSSSQMSSCSVTGKTCSPKRSSSSPSLNMTVQKGSGRVLICSTRVLRKSRTTAQTAAKERTPKAKDSSSTPQLVR